jgi:hypothetical protein
MRVVLTHGPIQKLHPAATPLQFFQQEHLVDVVACQAVRGGDQHQLKRPRGHRIAQPIQARATQGGAAVAVVTKDLVVTELPAFLHRMCSHMGAQPLHLLLHRLLLGLPLGRDAHIQGNSHLAAPPQRQPLLKAPQRLRGLLKPKGLREPQRDSSSYWSRGQVHGAMDSTSSTPAGVDKRDPSGVARPAGGPPGAGRAIAVSCPPPH